MRSWLRLEGQHAARGPDPHRKQGRVMADIRADVEDGVAG
jgi:hypothetical protein